jgi:hypothetical protein
MVALVEDYLARPAWRDDISRRSRAFVEEKMAWPLIAQKHLEIYKELTK